MLHSSAIIYIHWAVYVFLRTRMKYLGTKTGVFDLPKQLRVDPDLGSAVRFIAGVNCRSIQSQLYVWIVEGVQKEEERMRPKTSEKVIQPSEPKSVKVRFRQERSA